MITSPDSTAAEGIRKSLLAELDGSEERLGWIVGSASSRTLRLLRRGGDMGADREAGVEGGTTSQLRFWALINGLEINEGLRALFMSFELTS